MTGWRRFRHSKCYFCRALQGQPEQVSHPCTSCGAEWRVDQASRGHWVNSPAAKTAADIANAGSTRSPRKNTKKRVDYTLDKLVTGFMFLPLIPWMLWLSGQEEPLAEGEIPGLVVLALVMWAIAGAVGWHAGGRDYLVESACWALLCIAALPWLWVLLSDAGPPRGEGLTQVLVATVIAIGLSAALAKSVRLWPFEDSDARSKRHEVNVVFADPEGIDPYYVAICDCGWLGKFHTSQAPAFDDARSHTPNVKSEVERPLDEAEEARG